MIWIRLAWRNIWRNRLRSAIQFTIIAGSVFLGVVFHNLAMGNYRNMIRQGTRMGSGDVAIYNEKWFRMRRTNFTLTEDDVLPAVRKLNMADRYFLRFYISGYARSTGTGFPVNIVAMQLKKEVKDHPLLRGTHIESERDIIVGEKLARKLKISEGKRLVVMLGMRDGELTGLLFRVRRVIRTGIEEVDCCTAFADLDYVRNNTGYRGHIHEVAILLRRGSPDEAKRKLNELLHPPARAYTWRESMKELASAIAYDYMGLVMFMLFLYIVISVGTVNVLFMSVMDRMREFGMLRAIGMKPGQISRMIFTEGLLLGATAGITGLLFALLVNVYLSTHGINIEGLMKLAGQESVSYGGVLIEPVIRSTWEWKGTAGYTIFIVILSILASWFPARWINRKSVAELMRR